MSLKRTTGIWLGGGLKKGISKFSHSYQDIISLENLFGAWKEFLNGKRGRADVCEFALHLSDNIFDLHSELKAKMYRHGQYHHFVVSDPKRRDIHKATVRDRVLHRAIYRKLYPYFDRKFISDSFSCRNYKGTHRAINCFRDFDRKESRNHTRTCWILKCDIKRFFASIDQDILVDILRKHIGGESILNLLKEIIFSFKPNGLPLGNLTSQLFANIYLNEFDQFVKHKLRVKHYVRHADDFVILLDDKNYLENRMPVIKDFLQYKLKLILHPDKIFIKTLCSGIDFLGWVNFKNFRVLRTKTKRKMFKKIRENPAKEIINSYLGLLSHGNSKKLGGKIDSCLTAHTLIEPLDFV